MRFLLLLATLFLADSMRAQDHVVWGRVIMSEGHELYNKPLVRIYRGDSIVAKSAPDSSGFFPICIVDSDGWNDTLFLDSLSDRTGFIRLKTLRSGRYDIVVGTWGGIFGSVLRDVQFDDHSDPDITLTFPAPCPSEYSDPEYRYARFDASGELKTIKACPLGHADEVIPIIYGLWDGQGVRGYPGGCMVPSCGPYWRCERHDLSF